MSCFEVISLNIGSNETLKVFNSGDIEKLAKVVDTPYFLQDAAKKKSSTTSYDGVADVKLDTNEIIRRLHVILANTFNKIPFKQKSDMGFDKKSRNLEILPAAACVCPFTGCLYSGFRVEVSADEQLGNVSDILKCQRGVTGRVVYVIFGKVKNRINEDHVKQFTRFVVGKIPGFDELEFFYIEFDMNYSAHVFSIVDAIVRGRYDESRQVSLLWNMSNQMQNGWLDVGYRNGSSSVKVTYDPSTFTLFMVTDTSLQLANEALPMHQKCEIMYERILGSQCDKWEHAIATPSLVSVAIRAPKDLVLFRKEKCDGKEAQGYSVFEDKETFSTENFMSQLSNRGLHLTKVLPHRAFRTIEPDDLVDNLDFDQFIAYHICCETQWIGIRKDDFGRLGSMFHILKGGKNTYDECVRTADSFFLFKNIFLTT